MKGIAQGPLLRSGCYKPRIKLSCCTEDSDCNSGYDIRCWIAADGTYCTLPYCTPFSLKIPNRVFRRGRGKKGAGVGNNTEEQLSINKLSRNHHQPLRINREDSYNQLASAITQTMAYPQQSFTHTTFSPNSFWSKWRQVIRSSTLPAQLAIMKETGRYDAFNLKHIPYYDEPYDWPVPKHLFWDSDIGKWMEAACYTLAAGDDPELDKAVKELTEMIRGASQPDGYLNIHFTVVDPKGRFTNFRDLHEL